MTTACAITLYTADTPNGQKISIFFEMVQSSNAGPFNSIWLPSGSKQ